MDVLVNALISLITIVSFTVFGGWVLGIFVGRLVMRISPPGLSLRRLCRVALWIPLLILWPLTFWLHETTTLTLNLSAIAIGIVAVMLCVLHWYLLSCTVPDIDDPRKLLYATRAAIIHGLLVSLIIHLGLYARYWFSLPPRSEIAQNGYFAAGLLTILLIIIDRLLIPTSNELIAGNRKLLLHDLRDAEPGDSFNTIFTGVSIGIACALLLVISGKNGVDASIQIILRLKELALGAPILKELGDSIWKNLGVSLLAIMLGTIIASGMATVSDMFCRKILNVQSQLIRVFATTHVMIILVPCLLLGYQDSTADIWFSVQIIALILFFPCFETLVSFKECTWFCKLLLTLDRGLGYGFVGMLVGESINASHGVGFAITIARATSQSINGLAIALFVVTIFVVFSQVIRWLVQRKSGVCNYAFAR